MVEEFMMDWLEKNNDGRWYPITEFRVKYAVSPGMAKTAMLRLEKQKLIEFEFGTGRYYLRLRPQA